MTVLRALLRTSLENPGVSISDPALAEWIGGPRALAGVTVNEDRVYGLPAYFRGVAIVSGTLAGIPLKVYKKGTRQPVTQSTVLDNPNPRQTPFEFWQTGLANAVTWGNMFARKLRDGAGVVRQAWQIHPSRVRVDEVDITDANPAGKLFVIRMKDGTEKRYTSDEIFHVPYLSPDGIAGVRPLQLFRQSLGISIAADETAAGFYGNKSMLSGVLQTDAELDEDKADRVKARWREKTSGVHRAGEVAVLDKGLKFEPLTMPPGDAELLDSRRFSVTDISRMVGLPPHLLGDVQRSTSWGAGIEAQVLGLIKFNFNPWCVSIEQRVTRELLPGGWTAGSWFAEHSLEGLLRGDSVARANFYRAMVQIGALTLNEVRVLENEEPMEGLDVFMIPKNMTLFDPAAGDQAAMDAEMASQMDGGAGAASQS